jgi:hypothetical protein
MYLIIYLRGNKKQAIIFDFPWCRLAGKSIVHSVEMDIPGNETLAAIVCSREVKPLVGFGRGSKVEGWLAGPQLAAPSRSARLLPHAGFGAAAFASLRSAKAGGR